MYEQSLLSLIRRVKDGDLDEHELVRQIRAMPFRDLGEVKFDTHRALRKGFAEIVYCPGKSDSQIESIAAALAGTEDNVLFSRATAHQYGIVKNHLQDAVFHEKARIIGAKRKDLPPCAGLTVITAGSSDVPVAEEAAVTAEYMGCTVERLYDVGVAGLHRLLAHVDVLQRSRAIVAVAGWREPFPASLGGWCPVPWWPYPRVRLRREPRRHCAPAHHAELLRFGSVGDEHRQRPRRGVLRCPGGAAVEIESKTRSCHPEERSDRVASPEGTKDLAFGFQEANACHPERPKGSRSIPGGGRDLVFDFQ